MDNKVIKLDLKDKKILNLLDFDSRKSNSKIAKKVGLSKQGVEYKLNNLLKKGVVEGFYPVINVPKMGYLYCRLALVLQNVDEKIENELMNYVIKSPKIFWVFTTQGIFDILIVIWAESISEFKEVVTDILSKYGKYISEKNESIATNVIHYQHRYLLRKKDTKVIEIKETSELVKIEEVDKKILGILCEDARIKVIDIAKKLKLSSKTVSYRIKKLEKSNIIEGYRPIINHNKLGYTYYKLWIKIQFDNIIEIKTLYEFIKENPIVLYIVEGIGFPEELDIEVMVENNLELFNFIKDLKLRFPNLIAGYKSFMFFDTKKVRYLPF